MSLITTRGLKDALIECVLDLKSLGHDVNVDVIADALKCSRSPKYAKFTRVKDKTLKREIQILLPSVINNTNNHSANEQVRKLYLGHSASKVADTSPRTDDGSPIEAATNDPGIATRTEDHWMGDSDQTLPKSNKRARRKTEGDSKRSDPGAEDVRYKKARGIELSEPPQWERRRKEFLPESLPAFTLDSLGGVDKAVQEIWEHVIRPLQIPEIYKHLGIKPIRGILLHGSPGSGKTKLALAAAGEAGVPFFKIGAPEIVSGMSGESEAALRSLFDSAKAVAPSLIFIDEVDAICPRREHATRQMENRIVSQLNYCFDNLAESQVLVLGATNRIDALDPMIRRGGRFEREIAMGIPDEKARAQILKLMAKEIKLSEDVNFDVISRITPGFVGADLEAVAKEAGLICINRVFGAAGFFKQQCSLQIKYTEEQLASISVQHQDFVTAVQSVQPSAKREGFATTPDVSWDDVGGLADQRTQLEEQICYPIKEYELHQRLGLKTPAGVLLCGPPGCGKTLLAKAVAAESGANFISVKGPELLNKYVGESERAVRQVFERARASSPCVIFFDELDSLCCRRGSDGNSVSERVVNTLLTEMDGVQDRRNVYVIAATNRPELIDPAMLRPGRLEHLVQVPLPDLQKRIDILKRLGNRIPLSETIKVEDIAQLTERFSGADLAALLRQAVTLVLRDYRHQRQQQPGSTSVVQQQGKIGTAVIMDEKDAAVRQARILKQADATSDLLLRVEFHHVLRALEVVKPSVSMEHEEYYKKVFKKIGHEAKE